MLKLLKLLIPALILSIPFLVILGLIFFTIIPITLLNFSSHNPRKINATGKVVSKNRGGNLKAADKKAKKVIPKSKAFKIKKFIFFRLSSF